MLTMMDDYSVRGAPVLVWRDSGLRGSRIRFLWRGRSNLIFCKVSQPIQVILASP